MKKKIAIVLTCILIISLSVLGLSKQNTSYAKMAQMYVEAPDTIQKEKEFTVKVVVNSDVNLYSVDAHLAYDHTKLAYIPENENVTGDAGVLEIKDTYAEETKQAVYELTFKALELGDVEIALSEVFLIDYSDLDYIEVNASAKQFQIETNEQVEDDARLSALLVAPGKLDTAFAPDKMEYEVHVGMDAEMVGVSAIPMEESSLVEVDMPTVLQQGKNTIKIKVTALSGNTSTYVIYVFQEEQLENTEEQLVINEQVTEKVNEEKISEESVSIEDTEQIRE